MLDENGNIIVDKIEKPTKPDSAATNDDVKTVNIDNVDYNLDNNGNALDSEGKVFKTIEEIAKLNIDADNNGNNDGDNNSDGDSNTNKDEVVIEIDSIKYKLNETGDAIDNDGNIKFTKDEISKFKDDSDAGELNMTEVIKLSNIKPLNDKGEFNEYENTLDGLSNYISDIQDESVKQGGINYTNNLISKYPIVKNILNHLELNNGNFDGFTNKVTYKDVKIKSDDEAQAKSIISAARKIRGENDNQIEKYYNYLKDSDGIKAEVELELKYLQSNEKEINDKEEQNIINKRASEIINSNNYWGISINNKNEMSDINIDNSIYDIIVNKKSIKVGDENYKIPEKIRVTENGKITYHTPKDFFAYIYEPIPVKDTNNEIHYVTKDEIKLNNENSKRTNGDSVFEAFKRFVNYDTTQFITEQINQTRIKGFRNKSVKRYTTISKSDKQQGDGVRIV